MLIPETTDQRRVRTGEGKGERGTGKGKREARRVEKERRKGQELHGEEASE